MKILTVIGTRPEIIRLSLIVEQLEKYTDHVLVYTGQNFARSLRDVFFEQLGYRLPDLDLRIEEQSFARQAGRIVSEIDEVFERFAPDRVLILGDTNSGLAALPAARRRIPVFHLEAGNRCYDDRVPEELNRRVIDQCSSVLMPYTQRSKENLVREGFQRERIFVVGNPITEVLDRFSGDIAGSNILSDLRLEEKDYMLASMHRSENVDDPQRLRTLLTGLSKAAEQQGKPFVISLHPRTDSRLSASNPDLKQLPGLIFIKPAGFFEWVRLEQSAFCVATDSGTVQEECCILGVPNVTIRDVTERPETIEAGSSILTGAASSDIVTAIEMVVGQVVSWNPPPEYQVLNVSSTVSRIVLSHYGKSLA